jgi:hypothetical protein
MRGLGGKILVETAYAQGKMLNHHEWTGKLGSPLITPSDVDMIFDFNGHLLVCELSRSANMFTGLSDGQARLYLELVLLGAFACVLQHHVDADIQINTYRDVDRFSVMFMWRKRVHHSMVYEGAYWPRFVECYRLDREELRAKLRENSIEIYAPWKAKKPARTDSLELFGNDGSGGIYVKL